MVLSAGHWAERHALIVLVALGESIIALGLGPKRGLPLTGPVAVAALLGVVIVATLWWAYFDTLAFALEQALHQARDPAARLRLARTAYTFLHLPIVAGIILFALGLKDLLAEAASPDDARVGAAAGRLLGRDPVRRGRALPAQHRRVLVAGGAPGRHWPLLVTVLALVAAVPAVAPCARAGRARRAGGAHRRGRGLGDPGRGRSPAPGTPARAGGADRRRGRAEPLAAAAPLNGADAAVPRDGGARPALPTGGAGYSSASVPSYILSISEAKFVSTLRRLIFSDGVTSPSSMVRSRGRIGTFLIVSQRLSLALSSAT